MSASALQTLRELYPQRYALRPEDVAHVLRGQSTRGVVQRVREGMQSGRYPGARKIDGLIQMPLEALAEILDPAPRLSLLFQPSRPLSHGVARPLDRA